MSSVRNSHAPNAKDQHLFGVWTCETHFRRDKIKVNAIIIIFFCFTSFRIFPILLSIAAHTHIGWSVQFTLVCVCRIGRLCWWHMAQLINATLQWHSTMDRRIDSEWTRTDKLHYALAGGAYARNFGTHRIMANDDRPSQHAFDDAQATQFRKVQNQLFLISESRWPACEGIQVFTRNAKALKQCVIAGSLTYSFFLTHIGAMTACGSHKLPWSRICTENRPKDPFHSLSRRVFPERPIEFYAKRLI